ASFQWPLRSVTDAVSTRVTVVEAQPADASRKAPAPHPRRTVPMRGRPSLGATFVLLLLQAFERLLGVLPHKVPRRIVELLHLPDLFLELVKVQLGQLGTGAVVGGLFGQRLVPDPRHGPDSVEGLAVLLGHVPAALVDPFRNT